MIVIIEERQPVASAYAALFGREGVAVLAQTPAEFAEWAASAPDVELEAIEAILLGGAADRQQLAQSIRAKFEAALIAVIDEKSLEETLGLFAAGVDDVVRKPVHVREIMARVRAIRRRAKGERDGALIGEMRIFADGRDPEVRGEVLPLPRRERRILEYLVANKGCRVSKSQIFNSVYGLFSEDIDENVVESHISKLRKRLRHRLGYDPIDSQRFLGYRLIDAGRNNGSALAEPRGEAVAVDRTLMPAHLTVTAAVAMAAQHTRFTQLAEGAAE